MTFRVSAEGVARARPHGVEWAASPVSEISWGIDPSQL